MNLIVCVRHVNYEGIAVLVELAHEGKSIEVLCLILGNLLSVHAQRLCEIAETIEETDGAHVYIAVRSLLQIVTCEHSETSGINLQHVVQSVFH